MSKDEPGRLFSKVTKFVRNPLKDWSALDAQESLMPADGYSREMLKEMIERRQRNDFIRRREFEMLRKLRQKEVAAGVDATYSPSSFNLSNPGPSEGWALTLKKIDEIEEQMSQQWWKNRALSAHVPVTAEVISAQRARAYADTLPGVAIPPFTAASVLLPVDSVIDEAAICFARNDDAGSEAVLLQTIASGGPGADHDDSWRALFDLYRATGEIEKFERMHLLYEQRFGRRGPQWISFRLLARDALASRSPPAIRQVAAPWPGNGWICSSHLTREGLGEMMKVLGVAGPVWELDWHALSSIDPAAVAPLKALFVHWGSTGVQLRFAGEAALLSALAAVTLTNDRSTEVVWWELHMAVLRAMHEADNFELVALNYCLTYEVSPPPWEDPYCSYASFDSHSVGPSSLTLFSDIVGSGGSISREFKHAMLTGDLSGTSFTALDRLDADLAASGELVISCAGLVRMDFMAIEKLLGWVKVREARGECIEFIRVHRLIAAFFKVAGIAELARISVYND